METINFNNKDMTNGIIKTFKKSRRIICYITHYNGIFSACTGKPSDACCLAWKYDNLADAEATANEYFINRTKPIF